MTDHFLVDWLKLKKRFEQAKSGLDPFIGIIGHNCILPKFRGQGFGKQQVIEILKRLIGFGIKTAKVTTNDNSFFIPAQRMYISCGFKETVREPWTNDPNQDVIHYQKKIG